jgi:hypothetical protein
MMKTITALMVMTLIAIMSMGNAYAIEGDGTSHVEVDEYPFNITVEEGGSITIHNNGENTINFVSHGWFEGSVPTNDAIALEFPVVNCGTTCFTEGMYYISDLNGGQQSTIEIVKPYVAPEPVYVAPVEPTPEINFGATSSETIGTFETISNYTFAEPIIVEPSSSTWVGTSTGIQNVATYEGEVDLITMQTKLAEVTLKFNESITKLAEQKIAIENHSGIVQSLNTQIGSLNATSTEVSTLEQTILSLQLEKDELNAQITTLGNTTSSQLAEITALQGDTTLDVKIAELESQIVTLTNANVTATSTIAELNAKVVSASDTSVLDSKIADLEAQVVTLTNDRDQWKQLANNWYAVAMDQLKVMVDVLGL